MWRILQADSPEAFVLATGRTETVKTFVNMAYVTQGIELEWEGQNGRTSAVSQNRKSLVAAMTLTTVQRKYSADRRREQRGEKAWLGAAYRSRVHYRGNGQVRYPSSKGDSAFAIGHSPDRLMSRLLLLGVCTRSTPR